MIVEEITIHAPIDMVWGQMIDIDGWPRWTPSVMQATRLDEGPLPVGAQARLVQPKMRPAVWTVTALDEARSLSWVSMQPGVEIVATHDLRPVPEGSAVKLTIDFQGLLAPYLPFFFGKQSAAYMRQEAEGLKAVVERGMGDDRGVAV